MNDAAFKKWIMAKSELLGLDIVALKREKERHDLDLDSLRICWDNLNDSADRALKEIDRYHVSPKLYQTKELFRKTLENLSWAGFNGVHGCEFCKSKSMKNAATYFNLAVESMEECLKLL